MSKLVYGGKDIGFYCEACETKITPAQKGYGGMESECPICASSKKEPTKADPEKLKAKKEELKQRKLGESK